MGWEGVRGGGGEGVAGGGQQPDKELCGDDGHTNHSVQLLQKLEAVGVLELEVDSIGNDLQQSMQHGPGLALEHSRDQLG